MALSTRIFRRSVWLLAVTSSAGIASFCDPAPGWTAAWIDEFDGNSLNAADWNTIVGTDVGGCRDALCTAANVVVSGGVLTLISNNNTVGNYNYTTGAVTTAGKHNWTYAPAYRLCVSAILPGGKDAAGQGLWPAIWLMPDVHSCDPDLGEIDILEEISGEGVGYGTYHWQTTYPKQNCTFPVGHEHVFGSKALPWDWDTGFHEYAVEHSSTYVAFVYDGVVILNASGTPGNWSSWSDLGPAQPQVQAPSVDAAADGTGAGGANLHGTGPAGTQREHPQSANFETTGTDGAAAMANVVGPSAPSAAAPSPSPSPSPSPVPTFWDVPFYLILNTAVGGGWPGMPNASTVWPAAHVIDYVRVATKTAP